MMNLSEFMRNEDFTTIEINITKNDNKYMLNIRDNRGGSGPIYKGAITSNDLADALKDFVETYR